MKEAILFSYIGMTFFLLLIFSAMVTQYKDEHPWVRTWPARVLIFIGMIHAVLVVIVTTGTFE